MELKKHLKAFWSSTNGIAVCTKRELLFGGTAIALAGMVLGMLLSPRKTKYFGCVGTPTPKDEDDSEDEEA